MSPYTVWISKISDTDVVMAPLGSGGVVTVDMGGYVRVWETGLDNLQRSLLEWRKMIGSEDGRPIQVGPLGRISQIIRKSTSRSYFTPKSLVKKRRYFV